ncbi:MAG: hypothetical protein V4590_08020, partial [Bacteroidota bacterium]
NQRPTDYKSVALPAELKWPKSSCYPTYLVICLLKKELKSHIPTSHLSQKRTANVVVYMSISSWKQKKFWKTFFFIWKRNRAAICGQQTNLQNLF